MQISTSDTKAILEEINSAFIGHCVRAYMSLLNPSLKEFIEAHLKEIDPQVVFIDNNIDMGAASRARNSLKPTLFVFTENMRADSYITSCADKVEIPEAIRLRVFEAWHDAQPSCEI
nr:hypothetical protein [Alteromonas macleodii]|tara:strand:+ start:106 stop:456 length:351 start_codon:yes stop_codon:yes gene_type:complete